MEGQARLYKKYGIGNSAVAVLENSNPAQSWGIIGRGQWKKVKKEESHLHKSNFEGMLIWIIMKNKIILAKDVGK